MPFYLCFRALDESIRGSGAGEWAVLLAGPALSGQLGAPPVAPSTERVPVPREQWARRDELVGVARAGEAAPDRAAVGCEPQSGEVGSAGQCVGPVEPWWIMPPQPAAIT